MKKYVVSLADLATTPLNGNNTRGIETENFEDIAEARVFAESRKDDWDIVTIYKRIKNGDLEKVEGYQNGRLYKVDS